MQASEDSSIDSLELETVIDRAIWAVRHATHRDGYSGGYINAVLVNSTGIFHMKRIDCRLLPIGLESK